ncbi:MAG: hypothetical protein ACSLFF_11280 [Solirubrobacterales bacterium]
MILDQRGNGVELLRFELAVPLGRWLRGLWLYRISAWRQRGQRQRLVALGGALSLSLQPRALALFL